MIFGIAIESKLHGKRFVHLKERSKGTVNSTDITYVLKPLTHFLRQIISRHAAPAWSDRSKTLLDDLLKSELPGIDSLNRVSARQTIGQQRTKRE